MTEKQYQVIIGKLKKEVKELEAKVYAQSSIILSLEKDKAELREDRDKYREWFHTARKEIQELWDDFAGEDNDVPQ